MIISNVNSEDVNEKVTENRYVIEEVVLVQETHRHYILATDEDEAIEIACESVPDYLEESHVMDVSYEVLDEQDNKEAYGESFLYHCWKEVQ